MDRIRISINDVRVELAIVDDEIAVSELGENELVDVSLHASPARQRSLSGSTLGDLVQSGRLLRAVMVSDPSEDIQEFYYRHLGPLLRCEDLLAL
jgi:hypothetical protein